MSELRTLTDRPTGAVPSAVRDHRTTSWGILALLAHDRFTTGELPFASGCYLARVPRDHPVIPQGGQVIRTVVGALSVGYLIEGPGWLARLEHEHDGDLDADVFAATRTCLDAVVGEIRSWAEPPSDDPGKVDLRFVRHVESCGARFTNRTIDVPAWPDIQANYPTVARRRLEPLISLTPASKAPGRLLLLHGPPGTGKTTLIRALASHWRRWCATTVVIDPDVLFRNSAYLSDVVLAADSAGETISDEHGWDGRPSGRWTLLIAEDCDELLRADAKKDAGQALSRLLNVADGILGQGLRVLFCLTTNEPLDRLHPAIIRPGRCLANVEVPAFPTEEANAWLAAHTPQGGAPPATPTGNPATLAELYGLLDGGETTRR